MTKHSLSRYGLYLLLALMAGLSSCTRNGMPKKQSNARSRVDHLIIKEVFYIGHYWQRDSKKYGYLSPKQMYDDDQYIVIYNPTDEVKYLDGLALCSNAIDPSTSLQFAPKDNFVNQYYGVGSMMCFPGTGKDHPIQPKQEVVIAKYAIDHKANYVRELEEASKDEPDEPFDIKEYHGYEAFLDLSKADFEWTNAAFLSNDAKGKNNPKVPDLEAIYTYTDSYGKLAPAYNFHDVSERSGLALIRLPWTKEDFAKNHKDSKGHRGYLHYITVTSSSFADFYVIEVPFSHVIDCITICPKRLYQMRPTKLDRGYNAVTEVASRNTPKNEYPRISGLALSRRWDGRKFVDDDNTTSDFEIKVASRSNKDSQGKIIR